MQTLAKGAEMRTIGVTALMPFPGEMDTVGALECFSLILDQLVQTADDSQKQGNVIRENGIVVIMKICLCAQTWSTCWSMSW